MKTATVAETQDHLSDLIEDVKGGQTVLIVEQGLPVARLVAANNALETDLQRFARLEREGIARRGRPRDPNDILDFEPVRTVSGVSAVQILIDDRRNGR